MVPPSEWLTPVVVQGLVSNKTGPMQGVIWFVPNEVTLRYGGKDYATVGCWRALGPQGEFRVELSRCDIPGQEFEYDVYFGDGHWSMQVVPREDGLPCEMSELIDRKKQS